jgi:hypothetical protein
MGRVNRSRYKGLRRSQLVLKRNSKKYNENRVYMKMTCPVFYTPVSITSFKIG